MPTSVKQLDHFSYCHLIAMLMGVVISFKRFLELVLVATTKNLFKGLSLRGYLSRNHIPELHSDLLSPHW